MSVVNANGTVELQRLRAHLYDLLGLTYSAVSPAPACFPLLQLCDMIDSPSGYYQCRGRVRGVGFAGKRFSVQEVRALGGATDDDSASDRPGFEGLIVSIAHTVTIRGRTVIVKDRGPLNPTHIDGMKRVGVPSRTFEALYEIYGDDQIEARTLVPPDFLERLLDFDSVLNGGHANLAFVGRSAHLVLPTGRQGFFSKERSLYDIEQAARLIASEMIALFSHVSRLQTLISKADRHCPRSVEAVRDDYYRSAVSAIEPAVMAAVASGDIKEDRRAKYLTKEAFMIDPDLHGLLMPRV